jgi:hypothetical protein
MAKQRYYLDSRVLTAFFFAAMPFVAVGSFIVVNQAKNHLRESVGVSLEQRAVQTKLALEEYVAEQVVHLRLVAMDPEVLRALSAPPPPVPEPERPRLEDAWANGKDAKLNASLLDSPAAARLRPLTLVRPSIKQIQVVDTTGRVVAASSRGGRLFYGESAWFKDLSGQEGDAEVHVGELFRPSGSSVSLLEIAFPVRGADGSPLGAVRMLLNAADLYTVLAPVRIGRTGHATLVRAADGLVLASDDSDRVLKQSLPGFEALRNAMEGFPLGQSGQELFGHSGLRRGYWTIPEVKSKSEDGQKFTVEPARIVGYSPVDQIPDVQWLVVVEQERAEALAPIESVTRYLWVHFIGVFVTVILLALYFSFKLERPVMDEKLHLHEEHVPAGMRSNTES